MGRILAIDYGAKRTGLAVTDPLRIIAGALDTVPTAALLDYVKRYVVAEGVDLIVVGMPRQMSGAPSASYSQIRRWSSVSGRSCPGCASSCSTSVSPPCWPSGPLSRAACPRAAVAHDKGLVDRVSATIILQGYMESAGRFRADGPVSGKE